MRVKEILLEIVFRETIGRIFFKKSYMFRKALDAEALRSAREAKFLNAIVSPLVFNWIVKSPFDQAVDIAFTLDDCIGALFRATPMANARGLYIVCQGCNLHFLQNLVNNNGTYRGATTDLLCGEIRRGMRDGAEIIEMASDIGEMLNRAGSIHDFAAHYLDLMLCSQDTSRLTVAEPRRLPPAFSIGVLSLYLTESMIGCKNRDSLLVGV